MRNALVDIRFTLDVPEEKVAEIVANAGVEETESDDGYRAGVEAVERWIADEWHHRLDWMTAGGEEFDVTV